MGNFHFKMAAHKFNFIPCCVMNIVTVFTILLQLNGLLLIWTINQKRRQATILNLVLSERRRATQKLKLAKQRRLNRKKKLLV